MSMQFEYLMYISLLVYSSVVSLAYEYPMKKEANNIKNVAELCVNHRILTWSFKYGLARWAWYRVSSKLFEFLFLLSLNIIWYGEIRYRNEGL